MHQKGSPLKRPGHAGGRVLQLTLLASLVSSAYAQETTQATIDTPQGSVQFSMTLTVDDGTGRRYWLGQAYYTGSPDDQETAFSVMARTLVEQFGRTVRQRSFRIQ